MKQQLIELSQAAAALWVIPFAPLALVILAAWAADWAVPSLVAVAFLCGWPWVWFRWIQSEGEVE